MSVKIREITEYHKTWSKYIENLNIIHILRVPLPLKFPIVRMFHQTLKIVLIIQGPCGGPTPFNLTQPLSQYGSLSSWNTFNPICLLKYSYAYSYMWLNFVSTNGKLLEEILPFVLLSYLPWYTLRHIMIAK